MAHIRWAQNEAGKVVLDDESVAVVLKDPTLAQEVFAAFLQALSITRQPRANLKVLYQGWIDILTALQAAQITGQFVTSTNPEQAAARRAALHRCRDIDSQIAILRTSAAKEKQVARQVEINLEIKKLQADRSAVWGLL
uniref:Uncharacterized protein n=1 Tax=Candidatus Nitrotoga fabula TaxID=2182327 RepID=A0A2X0QV05_9PROT|nr:conserved protein of unknown function [Candidatus Nitrotoga fabula]